MLHDRSIQTVRTCETSEHWTKFKRRDNLSQCMTKIVEAALIPVKNLVHKCHMCSIILCSSLHDTKHCCTVIIMTTIDCESQLTIALL